ncbi:NUDIX hydrolase [Herbidospora galbida]|uniref:NUDIX hydrolase n=1 Tax=Herbidospora galbida TaxID=2575442 RepID=A0A4U3MME1_9ACTN|nr:NUDIX hydrolase [Herbidospora galbida]TKK89287.1 NUDIX hydrolase [Herbidospora galbida]
MRHEYCLHCDAETVERHTESGRVRCRCTTCGQTADRSLIVDTALRMWHETAGVFVRDPSGRFLFFNRIAFPYALTIPAGHVEHGESPQVSAARELQEETGLRAVSLSPIATEPIDGDQCRRGADGHVWHTFLTTVGTEPPVALDEGEGDAYKWLTLAEAVEHDLTFAARHLIDHHADRLMR